jgi:hypothetical protein
MWIIQKNAVSDDQQASVQRLQISFKSGQIGYLIFISKSRGFSQSLLGIPAAGDTIPENQIAADSDTLRITKVRENF